MTALPSRPPASWGIMEMRVVATAESVNHVLKLAVLLHQPRLFAFGSLY